ncbi:hypothetical protein MQE36_14040 [Zhouia spongiae]|uniref:YtkA-like domain-containing protein n=1 Tax=Zhouia spongiae TaxID=2202721 RepID=A0ABY3YKI0_9FLAO|nr:hypothetical protein [Zhouia spongiae]UNY98198.1 hypothetical protein MQE36_14040 [Zhouia spongiae]
MKNTIRITTALTLFITLISCSSDDNTPQEVTDPVAHLQMVETLNEGSFDIELYSETDQLHVGYNALSIRIKDNTSKKYIENAAVDWNPVMHMTSMQHSCPKSEISVSEDKTVYTGFVVFQMPGNSEEYWNLKIDFNINGEAYSVSKKINVVGSTDDYRTVNVFMGNDENRYVLANIPADLSVSVNDFEAVLFKMENMMDFSVVENYIIEIDPRMPGMNNHSSPNNEHLSYDAKTGIYKGKLSLTMTGYWKINLKVLNNNAQAIKGEDVTEENEASSIYFDLSI